MNTCLIDCNNECYIRYDCGNCTYMKDRPYVKVKTICTNCASKAECFSAQCPMAEGAKYLWQKWFADFGDKDDGI